MGQQEPYDQRTFDGRQDVLVYQTPPLEQPVEVTGPITVTLFAESSAPDTDWVVKLHDVWPSGFTQELCHGILRARYRDGYDTPSLLRPGDVYEFTITVNPVSNLFLPGHRIRVDVTSSDFPNFDRNHNTGGNDYFESDLQTGAPNHPPRPCPPLTHHTARDPQIAGHPGVSRNPSSHRRSCKRHPGGTVTRKSLLTDNTKRIRESPCLCRNDVEGPTL